MRHICDILLSLVEIASGHRLPLAEMVVWSSPRPETGS